MRRLDRVKILTESDKQLLRDLKSVILHFVPDATVILYGSVSRGKQGPESDYDVLVLLGESVPKRTIEEMDSAIYDFELEREAALSVMVSTREEWDSPLMSVIPYHRNVVNDGVLV